MRAWLIVSVVMSQGVAWADPPTPIVVKSVTTTAGDNAEVWKVVATSGGNWCQVSVSAQEAMTITLAAPAAIASVEVRADSSVTGAAVVADGKPFKGMRVQNKDPLRSTTLAVQLGGGPVTTLVVTLIGSGHACVSSIEIPGLIVYGSTADTLWSDVRAAKAALESCKTKQLAATFVFPVTASSYTEDMDGMKEKTHKWTTAAKLSTGCKDKLLRSWTEGMKLDDPGIESTSATALTLHADTTWYLELAGGHWKLRGFGED